MVALSWLIYRLSDSELILGVHGFLSYLPLFLVGPFAGVLLDRISKIKVLVFTQSFLLLSSFLLAALTYWNLIEVWHILLISFLKGIANAFDMPARHSLVVDLIDEREILSNAIALSAAMFNAARLVGPAIGGLLIANWGEAICFFVDGCSFVGALGALSLLKIPSTSKRQTAPNRAMFDLVAGFRYVKNNLVIRNVLSLLALGAVFGSSYNALLPVFAKTVYNGGSALLGYLLTAIGSGALVSALLLAMRERADGLGRVIIVAGLGLSTALLILAVNSNTLVALCLLFVIGLSMTAFVASSNTVLQTMVSDQMRGRLMSLYTVAFVGMMPFGSLLGGAVANSFGVQVAVGGSGLVSFLIILNYIRPLIRIDQQLLEMHVNAQLPSLVEEPLS